MEHHPVVGPWLAAAYRLPGWCFSRGLGGVFRGTLVGIVHRGRISGRERIAAVELLQGGRDGGPYVVMASYGRRTDWLLNIQLAGFCELIDGRNRFKVAVRELPLEEGVGVFHQYELKRESWGRAFPWLMERLIGEPWLSSPESRRALIADRPIICFNRTGD